MSFINDISKEASRELAKERENFQILKGVFMTNLVDLR